MIKSSRLIIRPFELSDAQDAFSWLGDPEVMKFIPYGPDVSVLQTKDRITRYINHFEKYGFSKYIVIEKSSSEPTGDCGIMKLDGTDLIEIGYRIKKRHWAKGFATEAAMAVLNHAFETLRLTNIQVLVEPENSVSVHIIEKKLKFTYLCNDVFFGVGMRLYCKNNKVYPQIHHLGPINLSPL